MVSDREAEPVPKAPPTAVAAYTLFERLERSRAVSDAQQHRPDTGASVPRATDPHGDARLIHELESAHRQSRRARVTYAGLRAP